MKTFISSIIGFIFLGSIVSAQMTTFSQGDILSAGSMNQNFKHLQDQFFWNKKEINCSSDNLTATINDGYNHIVINGGCSIKSLTTGGVDFTRFCEDNSDHKPIHRIKITGKTGKSTDSITVGDLGTCGQMFGSFGGLMHLENIQINTAKVHVNDGGSMRIDYSSIYAEDSSDNNIGLYKGGLLVMDYSSAVHTIKAWGGAVGEFMNSTTTKGLEAELGSTFSADNMSMLSLEVSGNVVANINNSTINCSAKDINCVKVERMSYINLSSSTITGGANADAIVLWSTSQVELYNSTVNSTKSSSINVGGPYSYLNANSNTTINGTVTCGNNVIAWKDADLCQ